MATYRHGFVARKKLSTTVYITPEQDARLKALHDRTKVPVAEYIRQGIDLVLEKYRDQLPGQVDLRLGPR
jgi:predicted DNA-binding protein